MARKASCSAPLQEPTTRTVPPMCGSAFVVQPTHAKTSASNGNTNALTEFLTVMRERDPRIVQVGGPQVPRGHRGADLSRDKCNAGDERDSVARPSRSVLERGLRVIVGILAALMARSRRGTRF